MKNNKKNPVLLIVLVLIAGALVFVAAIVTFGFLTENTARNQARFSAAILTDLRRIEASLLDAETGQRGFIITEDPSYLSPYTRGVEEYGTAYSGLRDRLRDVQTTSQRMLLEDLSSSSENKLAELAQTVELVRRGERARAIAIVKTDLGKDLMDDIRSVIAQLENEEQDILQTTLAKAERVQHRIGVALIAALVLILGLLVMVFYLFRRSERLDRTEDLLDEVTYHRDRAELLAQELSHRVKNLFGIITSIVRMTGRGETDSGIVVGKISDRIGALARAHSLTTASETRKHVDMKELVQAVLEPYHTDTHDFTLDGPAVTLDSGILTPLGLILHELATNAVKYGAWSAGPGGCIAISWSVADETNGASSSLLHLTWAEKAGAGSALVEPEGFSQSSSGFGTKMIEMSTKQLKGSFKKKWNDGLVVELVLDLDDEFTDGSN